MPTGYTDGVCNGKIDTFEKFVLSCARAFGALVMMRDSANDAPIPEKFEPSTYNKQAADKAKVELSSVQSMSDIQCESAGIEEFEKAMKAHRECIKKATEVRGRLETMRVQVLRWNPPSSDHEGLKKFMLEQLDETIKFDGTPYDGYLKSAKNLTGEEWRKKEIARLKHDIEYHEKAHQEEVERTEGRNLWVKQLRESLSTK